jgi:hypothetical protein
LVGLVNGDCAATVHTRIRRDPEFGFKKIQLMDFFCFHPLPLHLSHPLGHAGGAMNDPTVESAARAAGRSR